MYLNPELNAYPHERMCGRCNPQPLVAPNVALPVTVGAILLQTSTALTMAHQHGPQAAWYNVQSVHERG